MPGGAAEQAGLVAGDIVREIDGRKIKDFNDLRSAVFESPEAELLFDIERNQDRLSLVVVPATAYSSEYQMNYGVLGVRSASGEFKKLGISQALYSATSDTVDLCQSMVRGLIRLVTGQASSGEIGGPVRIAELSENAASQGFAAFLIFTALISINLGLVNLLPIPALDGGHLVFFTLEAVLGRPLPDAVQGVLLRGGIALLLSLMIFVTIFDVVKKFTS